MNKEQTEIYHLIKEITQYAYKDNLEMSDFLLTFFCSDYFEKIVNYYEIIYYNPSTIYNALLKEHNFKRNHDELTYDINVINYISYIYLAFYFRSGESIKSITKMLTIDDILTFYEQYHTLDDERVIFKAKLNYNEKMNYIRKSRATGYSFDFSNNKKNLFIAKYLYLKLFNYPEIRSLKYTYNQGVSYLKSDIATLFVADYFQYQELIKNENLAHIRFNYPNNILLIFLKNDETINQHQLEEIFYNQPQIPFDKILIYKNESLSFINAADGYKKFNIFVTSLDIKKIESDYQNSK